MEYPTQRENLYPDVAGVDHEESTSGSSSNMREEKTEQRQMSTPHELALIVTICMAQILALAGLGQVLAPLYIIGDSFGVHNQGALTWYLAAFSLTVGTFILPAGRLGDMYGHKKIFIIGACWYGLWSLIAGFSVYSGSILFTISRGFQGVGPALIVPNALAIAGRSFEGKRKNHVFAWFGASAPGGCVIGSVFAAVFGQFAWWPWAFWTMATVCFAYAVMSFLIIPADELNTLEDSSKSSFDFAGTITGVCGLVIFNFAWNQAAVVGWDVPYIYILLIVGIVSFGAFVYVETRIARYPLIPIKTLSKEAVYALAMIACGWGSFGAWIFYIWQLFENVRHHSAFSAAAQNSPVAVSGVIASLSVGYLLSKVKVAYIMLVAMICFLVGQILLVTVPVGQTYWLQTFLAVVITPWGMDMSFPCGTIILSNGIPREHQGIAASLINTVVNYSISLSLGIAGTIIRQTNEGGTNVIGSYRNAWYFAIGLDGLGMAIAAYYVWICVKEKKVT